ncbi:MAG: bifunctional adenosylcobinamide kinase/adenosylcobinamide-phosphate guanylyltransferase [Clostridia bacterium]|nr:bifunctional adenosylcobinamide kinase/adenosylcobinamide-phosphate guanylyltransferase [Clostridia bacterium]
MNVLISGGCKNGKTAFAQEIALKLSGSGRRYYVATMLAYDDEDPARIDRHINDNAVLRFETIEQPRNIAACLDREGPDGTFLVDSVTALLLNEMFPDIDATEADPDAVSRCRDGLLGITANAGNAIFVSDYIYSDAARYDAFTENYRSSLAAIDRALAEACDTVIELCAGNVIFHKGGLAL